MNEFPVSAHSMSVLRQYSERNYLDRLMTQVAGLTEPDEAEEETREHCRELAAMARSHGLTTEFEIAAYVTCGFAEGHGFDRHPPYRSVIESSSVSARSKAEMLMLILEYSAAAAAGGHEEGDVGEAEA